MLTNHRKSLILAALRRDGQVLAKDFACNLGLSEDTIRRDLRELAAEGRLQRVHGGALPVAPPLPDLAARETIATGDKAAIARRAVAMIEPGAVVFLDGGSTSAEIVRALPRQRRLTVVTHAPTVAVALLDHPEVTVELIGGRLYRHSMVAVGAAALEAIADLRVDVYFMGVTGVHPAHGFTTGDREEAAVKRAIAAAARRTVVSMTSDKADAVSPYRILPFPEVDCLIAGPDVPQATLAAYREAGVDVVQA